MANRTVVGIGPGGWDSTKLAREQVGTEVAHTEVERKWGEGIMIDLKTLTQLLWEASEAHHAFEKRNGRPDASWAPWYADYIICRLTQPGTCPFQPPTVVEVGVNSGRELSVE